MKTVNTHHKPGAGSGALLRTLPLTLWKMFLFLGIALVLILPSQQAKALTDLLLSEAGSTESGESGDATVAAPSDTAAETAEIPLLTIEEAIGTARESNRNLLMAEQAIELARAGGRSALAGYLPDLSLAYSYTRFAAAQTIDVPDIGSFEIQPADNFYAGLNFRYPIYKGGSREATERASEADISIAELRREQAVALIDMGTIDAYCSAREAFDNLAVRQSSRNALQELEKQAQALYDAGYMPMSDLLSVQVARAAAEQQVFESKNSIQTSQSALALAIGMDIGSQWTLAPVEYPIVEPPFLLETLTQWAMENRPELKEIQAQREKVLAQIESIKATEGPNVDFQAQASRTGSSFGSVFDSGTTSISGTISIWWDLYNFGRTDDLLGPLNAQLELIDIQEKEQREQIRSEVESAFLSLQNLYSSVQVAKESVSQSEEALRVSRRRMEEGLAIMVEVLNAEATWTGTGARVVFSTHAYYRVLAMLSRAAGMRFEDMIALIEASGESDQ